MKKILVVEDELDIQEIIVEFLRDYGFEADTASDGVEALVHLKKAKYDLVLLDIMLPKIDGYAVLEMIRKDSNVPVIMLTAMEQEADQIKGFDLRADDYITKPFSMNLVIRRIEAVLRRNEHEEHQSLLKHKEVKLDPNACKVYVSGEAVYFTYKEYELLKLMLENKNRVFSRDDLLDKVWGYDYYGGEKVVNNHIMRIRKKLGDDFITTVRGIGYRIDD